MPEYHVGAGAFAKGCSFYKHCDFGHSCFFEGLINYAGLNDCVYVFIDSIDFSNQKFYVFKSKQGTYIQADCFWGTIDEFKEQLDNTI